MSSNQTKIRIRQVQYWLNWLSQGFATGKWDSIFLGRGYEFQGVAPFTDDPDIVRINWQASRISGELQVSQYSEERNIHLYLLGNLGSSMAFGSTISKQDRLALIAAAFAYSARRTKDSFHFVGYADHVEHGFPEIRDETYPMMLARSIMEFPTLTKKRGGLLKATLTVPSHRSFVIIVSDLLGSLDGVEQSLAILAPKHEVIPLILWDPREVSLPEKGFGLYPFSDLETRELSYVLLTDRNRKRFEENSLRRKSELEQLFSRYGIRPRFLTTGDPEQDIDAIAKIFIAERSRV